jgi:hypothetical protein
VWSAEKIGNPTQRGDGASCNSDEIAMMRETTWKNPGSPESLRYRRESIAGPKPKQAGA